MLFMAIHFYLRGRNAPEEVGLPTLEEECDGKIVMGECREDDFVGFKVQDFFQYGKLFSTE